MAALPVATILLFSAVFAAVYFSETVARRLGGIGRAGYRSGAVPVYGDTDTRNGPDHDTPGRYTFGDFCHVYYIVGHSLTDAGIMNTLASQRYRGNLNIATRCTSTYRELE